MSIENSSPEHPPQRSVPAQTALLDPISDAVFALDGELNLTYLNHSAAALLGGAPADLLGRSYAGECPPALGPDFAAACRQARTTGRQQCLETRIAAEGRWIEHRISPTPAGLTVLALDITERRTIEASLQREIDFSNALLDSLPGVFYLYDDTLRFLRWNKNFERVTGYSAAEIAAMTPLDFFAGPERSLLDERISQVFKDGVAQVEAMFVAKDGTRTPYYFTGRRTRQYGRDCLIGVGIDVSQRQRAEAALRESEERYRQFVETSPYAIGIHQDGAIKYVNPAAVKLFGAASADELLGTPVAEWVAPGTWAEMQTRIATLLEGEPGLYPIEESFRRTDGSLIPVELFATPFSHRGQPAVQFIARDISDRQRAEQVLEISERRLSLVFDTVGDVLFLLAVEPEGVYRFESVNPAFLAVTGLSREQVVGKRMEEVLPPTAHEFVRAKYAEAIAESRTVRWEEVSAYPTGTLYGEVAVAPALDSSGICTHLIGSVHDITAIRRAQQEIEQLNQGLERRVAERTVQLQSANKELESFSYSVSHDLRAPLRAISGFAEIIARRHRAALNDEGRRYFDNIVQASERMSNLIDDLLAYSRIGRSALRFEPVDLGRLLEALAHDMGQRLRDYGGHLEIPGDLPTLPADKTLLTQIFSNLLENAVTYRKPDTPVLIRLEWRAEADAIIIAVIDNGIGISAEYHEKIFTMFQRLHSEEAYPGTGIGLATVKKSVELLSGSVWVESDGQSGSQFYLRLPKERP